MDDLRNTATPLVIRGPRDLAGAVPFLLGFHPEDSLVAVGCGGPHASCALRFPLPVSGEAAHHLAALLAHHGFTAAMLVAYGPAENADGSVAAARRALGELALPVREAVRVHSERYWSYLCDEPSCCPPEGSPLGTSALQAQAVVDGLVALPSRAALAATLAPVTGEVRTLMRHETERAERSSLTASGELAPGALGPALLLVRELAERTGQGGPLPPPRLIAELTVALGSLRVRDEAWIHIAADSLPGHRRFWLHVLTHAERRHLPAPACLYAYTAYLGGDGTLANLALDLSDSASPGYSMARLLRQALHSGLHPAEARIRLTAQDLADAYEDPPGLLPDVPGSAAA